MTLMVTKPQPPARHKRIRLDRQLYAEVGSICSVTVATRERRPFFAEEGVASAAVSILKERASRHGTPLYGYCFMPDHLHLVIGPSPTCDIIRFVAEIKNLTQREAWRRGVEGTIWQVSFWDHLLRAEEDLKAAVDYVLENPVRKGLVRQWTEWPYSGSTVFVLQK
jgi:putative transposase